MKVLHLHVDDGDEILKRVPRSESAQQDASEGQHGPALDKTRREPHG